MNIWADFIVMGLIALQGLLMITTGKCFFLGESKYTPESLREFGKKGGVGCLIMGLGGLLFCYALRMDLGFAMIVVGLVVAVIGIVIYDVFRRKCLKRK